MRQLWRELKEAIAGWGRPAASGGRAAAGAIAGSRTRTQGRPPSGNGASSFHLIWELGPHDPLVEVSAVVEILRPPAVTDLYFWALQVDFQHEGTSVGGAHAGLQWNRDFPGHTAVNWGGYRSGSLGGGELPGSPSALPGPPNRDNTREYPWIPQRQYLLRIYRSPDSHNAWRAEVQDRTTEEITVIRDLYTPGDRLSSPVVWSEVFADCGAPSVAVRWSRLQAVDASGRIVAANSVRVNYQAFHEGGCTNTSVLSDPEGFYQVTNTPRDTPHGTVIIA